MGTLLELQGKAKQEWKISKSTELLSIISKYLSKLLLELDVTVSESKSRFYYSLSKLELPPLDWSQLGLEEGPGKRIEASNSFFN